MRTYSDPITCVDCGTSLTKSQKILSFSSCSSEKSGYRCTECFTAFTSRRAQRRQERKQGYKERIKRAIATYHERQEEPKKKPIKKPGQQELF